KKPSGASPVKAPKTTAEAKAGTPLDEKGEKKKGPASALKPKRASAKTAGTAKPAPPVAEPSKAEKKMILVKKRPSEPSAVDDLAPLRSADEALAIGAADPAKAVAPPGLAPRDASPGPPGTGPGVAPPPHQLPAGPPA